MKILFFVSSLHAGGAERVASTLASAWAQRGDQVVLAPTYTGRGNCFYPLHKDVKLAWLADRMRPLGRKLLAPVAKWFAIRRLIRETRPDIIVSFLTNVNVSVLLATYGMKVPVIVCERTNPAFSASSGRLLKFLRRMTYPRASVVCLQTHDSVAAFQNMVPGLRDVVVIPNPLPPDLLAIQPLSLVPGTGRHRLLAMGRLVSAKRFDWLIQIWTHLAAEFPDWDLYIWGEGPLRAALTQQIAQAGLEQRVFLPGRTDQPWAELAQADVFVLSSQVEGFPNVLMEAMALGLPCASVDCPSGPRELSNNGQEALLTPVNDAAALQQALSQLMQDPVLRNVLGRHASESVRHRYKLPTVLQQWDAAMARAQGHPTQETVS
ncbi:MAG: glycosyltransferase family 4 protein [Burkholderiaceae bacterium]|nr:glycosyltransferase family 4 protein [Burkholderiaceae bacterium]